LVTGFAACAKQLLPSLKPLEMIDTLHTCGHLYPYYDYAHGYGVPLAEKLLRDGSKYTPATTFVLEGNGENLVLKPTIPYPDKPAYIYYHIASPSGKLLLYSVMAADVSQTTQRLFAPTKDPAQLFVDLELERFFETGNVLRVYFMGDVQTITF
jgi:hypothetical protein